MENVQWKILWFRVNRKTSYFNSAASRPPQIRCCCWENHNGDWQSMIEARGASGTCTKLDYDTGQPSVWEKKKPCSTLFQRSTCSRASCALVTVTLSSSGHLCNIWRNSLSCEKINKLVQECCTKYNIESRTQSYETLCAVCDWYVLYTFVWDVLSSA